MKYYFNIVTALSLIMTSCIPKSQDTNSSVDVINKNDVKQILESDSSVVSKQLSISELETLAINFESKTLFYKDIDEYLGDSRLDSVYSSNAPELLDISKIFLLKVHKNLFKKARQGFNLNDMTKGQSQVVLDYYLINTGIKPRKEFLNSGIVYHNEKDKEQTNDLVKELIRDISKEINKG